MVLLNDNSRESHKDDKHGDLSDNHPAKMAAEEDDEGAVAPQAKRLPSRAARRHQISRSTSRQNHSNKNTNQSNSNNSNSKRSYKALPDASSSSTSMYTHRYNSSPSLLYVPPPFMRPDQSPAYPHTYHLQQQQQQDHSHPQQQHQQQQQRRAKATVAFLLSASEKTSSLERVGTPATFSRSDRNGSAMPTIRSAGTATTTATSRLEKDENLHPNSNQEHVLSTSAGSKKSNRTDDARHRTCPSEAGGASSSTASNSSSSTIGRRAADAVSRFRAMKRRIQEEEERQKHKEKMLQQQQRQREPKSRSGTRGGQDEEPEKDNDKNRGHHGSRTPAQPPPPPPLLPLMMVPQGRPSFIRPRLLSMASPSLPTIAEIVPGMTSESSSSSWDCSRASPASNSMSKSPYRPHPSWHQQQPPSQHELVEINSRTGHDKTTSRRSSTSLQPSFFSATNPTTPTRTQSSPRGYPQTPPSPLLVPLLPSIIMAPEGGKDHIGTPPTTGRGGTGRDNINNNMDSGYETTEASPVTSTPSSSSSSSPVACSPSDSLDLPSHAPSRSNCGTTTTQPPLSLEESHPPRLIATTTATTTTTRAVATPTYRSAPYSQPGRPSSRSPAVSASSMMAERSPSLSYVQRRRFRTVVPVRVFLESSDFFVPEHDSFLNLMPDEEQLYANMYARATSTSAPAVKVLL